MLYTNIISNTANKEIDDAYYYYSNENIAIGLLFITELEKLLLFIQSNPLAFRIVTKKYRAALLKKFPFSIYFVIHGKRIIILSVFHQKRKLKSKFSRT